MEPVLQQRDDDIVFALFAAFVAGGFIVSFLVLRTLPAAPPRRNTAHIEATHESEPRQNPAVKQQQVIPPRSLQPGIEAVVGYQDYAYLRSRHLLLPVQGVSRDSLTDTFYEGRGTSRTHEAIDILAPRNSRVLAVEDGTIERLWYSANGGNTIYQFDPSRSYAYYYAHLEKYAAGLKEGQSVRKGDVIGYVGTSGNAPPDTPHLHFTIFKLTAAKHWWEGTAINPYPLLKEQ